MPKPFALKGFAMLLAVLGSAPAMASRAVFPPGPPQETAQEAAGIEGRRILALRIVDESGRVLEENPAAGALKAGASYDSLLVRDALRELFASGRFAEIRAEAIELAGGLRLDFIVRENMFINRVRIEGLATERLASRALAALQLNLGERFTPENVNEALERLRQTLSDEGFFASQATYQLTPQPATRQMDVLVRVTPGPRARVGAVTLVNRTAFPDKEILDKSRLRPKQSVNPRRLERANDRVRQFLSKKGYLGARVVIRRGAYDAAARSLPLEVEAVAGSRVRVEVQGASVSQKDLQQLIPIYQEGAVDEDLLQEGRRNLRAYLERDGFFDSVVSFSERDDPEQGLHVITYTVERGKRRRLVGVEFKGNRYFGSMILRERLRMQPAAFLDRGRFSRRLLADDEAGIREMYVANGFEKAAVTSEIVESYGGKEEDFLVRFTIQEGQQTRVADLRIEGAQQLDTDTLLGVSSSTPGQPYSEFNVAGDRDNILATYFNEGFPEARFEHSTEPANQPNRVKLAYRITEGPQTRIKNVLLAGHEFTRPHVIERELRTDPPEPLRQGEVVESQRRLYNLGIFSRVQIAPQNPEGTERDKTLVVMVDEARRYTLAYGGGFEVQRLGSGGDPVSGAFRVSPRGLLEFSKTNFAGRAHTVSFKARASTLQGRALATYGVPYFLGRPKVNFLFTALADKTLDVRTFTSQRYEAGVQVEQQASRDTSFLYRYSFRKVLVDPDSLRVDPQQIPLYSQPTRISGFGMTWIRDRRDNPAEASKGDFNTADVSVAAKRLGSSASFVRLFIQNSTFQRISRNLVFARSTRFGVQEPLGDTAKIEIPLPELFFSGGGNSLRGFSLNQSGPRDNVTGFPIGGLAVLVFNNELRFPMKLPKLGNQVGGAVFYDAGNVFSRINRITLRVTPQSPAQLNYFSHTIGFGFRYATPIGPVRLDLAYLANPAQFIVDDGTGTGGTRLSRSPRFQFFFNIGSIF